MKIGYVAIVTSIIGVAGIAIVSLSYAAPGTKGRIISGSASNEVFAPCLFDQNPIMNRTVDFDGDGTDDFILRTCQIISDWYEGVVLGTATGVQQYTINLNTGSSDFTNYLTFTGTVGDSEPGTMTLISTGSLDVSEFPILSWKGTHVVLEGSGSGGLEGICGGGTYEGGRPGPPGTPAITNFECEFRFGDVCRGNM